MSASEVTQLDLSSFPESAPSVCIPRVFSNITRERVEAIFRNLDFGEVEKVDMVSRVNDKGERFQRVFVHFTRWNNDEQSEQVRHMLLSEQEVKVVYDDPWFWKLSASKSTRPEDRPKKKKRAAPFVDFTKTTTKNDKQVTARAPSITARELKEWRRELYRYKYSTQRRFADYLETLKKHPRFDEFNSHPPGHPLYNYIHGGSWQQDEEMDWISSMNCHDPSIPYQR